MENGLPILLLCFSAALFLYAGLTALSKTILLPRRYIASARIPDRRKYAVKLAKCTAVVALSPLISGAVGLIAASEVCVIVFGATMIAGIWLCTKIVK